MAVRVEKSGAVTTVIHRRPEVRNAMDPESAEALYAAFKEFEDDASNRISVWTGVTSEEYKGLNLE